jgi:membrane-bound lytic murein transglycosylase F
MSSPRWPMRVSASAVLPLAVALGLVVGPTLAFAADEDLAAIQLRGTLRVLVLAESNVELHRTSAGLTDPELVEEFAARQGLKLEEVPCGRIDQLIPALLAGRGDLVGVGLTVTSTDSARVAFTQPLRVVDEVLVGKKGVAGLPTRPADLTGRTISVLARSAAHEALETLRSTSVPGLLVDPVEKARDAEQLVYEVSRGERALAVASSAELDAIETYNPGLQRLFAIAERRPAAWAVRPSAQRLRAALDGFLLERFMVGHASRRFTGDLDGIVKRGELRVITRNNAVSYFLDRGQPRGFDYELAAMLAKQLKVRLAMVVPPAHDLMVPWLLEGRGDVIAASYTVTPDRAQLVDFSRPYLRVQEMVVQRSGEPRLTSLAQLEGRRITVRPGSSYARTLARLQPQFRFTVVQAAEDQETEELIDAVASGKADLTVADSHILQAELATRHDVVGAFPLEPSRKDIAFAARVGNPKLVAAVNAFVKRVDRGLEFNLAYRRTFESRPEVPAQRSETTGTSGVSPFDAIFQKLAPRYGFDWRLTAAQAYQESRFDPRARSREGAVGLLQILPRTAKGLGFTRLTDPEECTHAGIAYLAELMDRLEPDLAVQQRVRFALAAYNVGLGHVSDARRLAGEQGLDPNRWFGNVEKAMLELQKPVHYWRARYGYARGSEPVRYVSQIQTRYEQYLALVP